MRRGLAWLVSRRTGTGLGSSAQPRLGYRIVVAVCTSTAVLQPIRFDAVYG